MKQADNTANLANLKCRDRRQRRKQETPLSADMASVRNQTKTAHKTRQSPQDKHSPYDTQLPGTDNPNNQDRRRCLAEQTYSNKQTKTPSDSGVCEINEDRASPESIPTSLCWQLRSCRSCLSARSQRRQAHSAHPGGVSCAWSTTHGECVARKNRLEWATKKVRRRYRDKGIPTATKHDKSCSPMGLPQHQEQNMHGKLHMRSQNNLLKHHTWGGDGGLVSYCPEEKNNEQNDPESEESRACPIEGDTLGRDLRCMTCGTAETKCRKRGQQHKTS